MPRFFVDSAGDTSITIQNPDAHHILHSLRMSVGDSITLSCDGTDYECVIAGASSEEVICNIISKNVSENEPDIKLTLYQAMPKGDKLETIIQKAVELGAYRIVPVLTRRCVSRPDEKSFRKKLERLNKISLEAAKQSGRGIIPEIADIVSYDKMLSEAAKADIPLICYEDKGGKRFSEIKIKNGESVSLIIGSEGGFDREEVERAEKLGIIPVWMGNRILRCETAPLVAISVIMNKSGNL